MTQLMEHPTVVAVKKRHAEKSAPVAPSPLEASWLRQLCLDLGADDVGFVAIDRSELDDQRADILAVYPRTKSLISFVCRMNREPIRSVVRTTSNVEFHRTGDHVNDVAHDIVAHLEQMGVKAVNPAMGFPMEMSTFPGKIWVVSHKPVAVAAGLGQMGIHRNVIHPKFGNFILLGTVLVETEISEASQPIDYNPCLSCKLCVAACPVGAISADGHFNFAACNTHNYREFMGGFTNWVGQVVDSKDAVDYRSKVSDQETVSMWQSLAFGPNYKAAYCMAVCPAGEDVIAPFLDDRKSFLNDIVKPLQEKIEPIYVVPGSDAEAHVAKRFPHKQVYRVSSDLRPRSVKELFSTLPLVFQRNQSEGMDTTYHFSFTGEEELQRTVIIRNKTIEIHEGLTGEANIRINANSRTWLRFLNKETHILWALITRRIRVKGSLSLLQAFGRSFPS